MKEKPILFSGEMVKAILDGRKTQTRRIMKPQPPAHWQPMDMETMIRKGWRREYAVGWRLWVRESAYIAPPNFSKDGNVKDDQGRLRTVDWAATMSADAVRVATDYGVKKTPSIHMPRWASRIALQVTAVRVERLQEIWTRTYTFDDLFAEGMAQFATWDGKGGIPTPLSEFIPLWNKINAKRGHSWESNPYVWVVEFKQV